MKDKLCYLVGGFQETGGEVQLSFLPEHPDILTTSAIGLWIGYGVRGDGKFMTPENSLKTKYHHLPIGVKSTSDYEVKENGMEFLCQNAKCIWFLGFVKNLVDETLTPNDFLNEYIRNNHGELPRSDSDRYVFQ